MSRSLPLPDKSAKQSPIFDSIEIGRVFHLRTLYQTATKYDSEDRETFGRLIREFETFVSRTEIASEFGISPATVSRWSNGKTAPASYVRHAIVERLAAIVDDIANASKVDLPQALQAALTSK